MKGISMDSEKRSLDLWQAATQSYAPHKEWHNGVAEGGVFQTRIRSSVYTLFTVGKGRQCTDSDDDFRASANFQSLSERDGNESKVGGRGFWN